MSGQGHHIGGTVGFLKGLRLLTEKLTPSRVVVVWEGGGSPRRRAIYPDYKSGRRPQKLNRYYTDIPDTYQNRDYQLALTIEALNHVPIHQIYVGDCEADDVIAYSCRYMYKDRDIVVVSSDKDLYQLIDDRVTQFSPGQKKFITSEIVKDKFGVYPQNMSAIRCFIGDPSDGLSGVKGAGFKTMVKRFPSFSLDEPVLIEDIIEEAIEKSAESKVKVYRNIADEKTIVRRNWKLMYLDISNLSGTQIQKIQSSVESYEPQKNKMELMRLLTRESVQDFDVDSFFMSLNARSV
jgi:5'-3' exonuclease